MVWRRVAAFILGGAAFMLLQPVLASIAIVLVVGVFILLLFSWLVPGGWTLFFGFRAVTGMFGRYLSPLFVLAVAALLVGFLALAAPELALASGFAVGGLAGLYAFTRFSPGGVKAPSVSPVWRSRPPLYTRPAPATPLAKNQALINTKPPKGWTIPVVRSSGFFGKLLGIKASALGEGVVVLGEAAVPAARAVVSGAVDAGARVVVIGNPYIAPKVDGIKLVKLGMTSFNAFSDSEGVDGFARRVWAEKISVPLVVACGLDTAEGGMVVRFLQKFAGARFSPDDVDKVVAEYGPTSSARLKDALSVLSTYFGEDYPPPSKLFGGGWKVLVVDTSRLSQSLQLFATMYLLYEAPRLFPGCVLVFDSAELGLPEQSVLPYDARHVWLRTLKAVESLKSSGFIMVASTGLLAPELLDLADTYIITRGLAHMGRALSERTGVDVNTSAIPVAHAYVFTRVGGDGGGYLFGGRLLDVEHADVALLEAEAEREATLLREEMLGPLRETALYAEFADMAEACYRTLRAVKSLSTPTPERVAAEVGQDRAVKQLLEKGYVLVDPAGVLGLTTLGEQALKDWELRVRKTQTGGSGGPAVRDEPSMNVQSGLQAFGQSSKAFDMSEPARLVVRAREVLQRGDVLQAVGIAYKAAVRALKEVTGTSKGHLTDLAEIAVEKGILKLEDDEVRRLYAANIEAKRLSRQVSEGEAVSPDDLKRLRDAAELLISLAERVVAFAENLPGGDQDV